MPPREPGEGEQPGGEGENNGRFRPVANNPAPFQYPRGRGLNPDSDESDGDEPGADAGDDGYGDDLSSEVVDKVTVSVVSSVLASVVDRVEQDFDFTEAKLDVHAEANNQKELASSRSGQNARNEIMASSRSRSHDYANNSSDDETPATTPRVNKAARAAKNSEQEVRDLIDEQIGGRVLSAEENDLVQREIAAGISDIMAATRVFLNNPSTYSEADMIRTLDAVVKEVQENVTEILGGVDDESDEEVRSHVVSNFVSDVKERMTGLVQSDFKQRDDVYDALESPSVSHKRAHRSMSVEEVQNAEREIARLVSDLVEKVEGLVEEEESDENEDARSVSEFDPAKYERAELQARSQEMKRKHAMAEKQKIAQYLAVTKEQTLQIEKQRKEVIDKMKAFEQDQAARRLAGDKESKDSAAFEEQNRQEVAFLLHMSSQLKEEAKKAEEDRALRSRIKDVQRQQQIRSVRVLKQKENSRISSEIQERQMKRSEELSADERLQRALALAQSVRATIELKRAMDDGETVESAKIKFHQTMHEEEKDRQATLAEFERLRSEIARLEAEEDKSEDELSLERKLRRRLTDHEKKSKLNRGTARAKKVAECKKKLARLQEQQYKKQLSKSASDKANHEKELQARALAQKLRKEMMEKARIEHEKKLAAERQAQEDERSIMELMEEMIYCCEAEEREELAVQQCVSDLVDQVELASYQEVAAEAIEGIVCQLEQEEIEETVALTMDDLLIRTEQRVLMSDVLDLVWREAEPQMVVADLVGELIHEYTEHWLQEEEDELAVRECVDELAFIVHLREHAEQANGALMVMADAVARRKKTMDFVHSKLKLALERARDRIAHRNEAEDLDEEEARLLRFEKEKAAAERAKAGDVFAGLFGDGLDMGDMSEYENDLDEDNAHNVGLLDDGSDAAESIFDENDASAVFYMPSDEEQVQQCLDFMIRNIETEDAVRRRMEKEIRDKLEKERMDALLRQKAEQDARRAREKALKKQAEEEAARKLREKQEAEERAKQQAREAEERRQKQRVAEEQERARLKAAYGNMAKDERQAAASAQVRAIEEEKKLAEEQLLAEARWRVILKADQVGHTTVEDLQFVTTNIYNEDEEHLNLYSGEEYNEDMANYAKLGVTPKLTGRPSIMEMDGDLSLGGGHGEPDPLEEGDVCTIM